jgi:Ca2+-binding RTX toxin-like protein
VIELAGNWSTNSSLTGTGGNLAVTLTDSSNESVTLTFDDFANGSKLTVEQQNGNTFIVDPPGTGVSATESPNTNTSSVLIGGPGNDTFVFHPGMGAETISNFNPQDTIELDHFANVQNLQQLASDVTSSAHGDALIELGHSDSITVAGMTAAQLQAHLQSFVHLH